MAEIGGERSEQSGALHGHVADDAVGDHVRAGLRQLLLQLVVAGHEVWNKVGKTNSSCVFFNFGHSLPLCGFTFFRLIA